VTLVWSQVMDGQKQYVLVYVDPTLDSGNLTWPLPTDVMKYIVLYIYIYIYIYIEKYI
jgi:hypothetical protein